MDKITTIDHDDIIAAAAFVRGLKKDELWEVMTGATLADDTIFAMAFAEWRFRFQPRYD